MCELSLLSALSTLNLYKHSGTILYLLNTFHIKVAQRASQNYRVAVLTIILLPSLILFHGIHFHQWRLNVY